jgi:translation initiation factor 2 alpha subunit (eIF-2alpha)
MAHFDEIPALLHFIFVKLGMDVDEGTKWVMDKLSRGWSKLISEAREIIKDKHKASKIIL